ncbi:MAG TPA: hypothetical protein VFV32_05365 [Acidimicrobiales bacterium]|nr:hypothetical protein [Acidimicrobiales bacterium]
MSTTALAPVVEHLPDGIVHVPLPTPFPVGPVNCYVLVEDPVTVIDPPAHPGQARLVGEALMRRGARLEPAAGARRVDSILLRGFNTYPVTVR